MNEKQKVDLMLKRVSYYKFLKALETTTILQAVIQHDETVSLMLGENLHIRVEFAIIIRKEIDLIDTILGIKNESTG